MKKVNSRQKGARGEREFAEVLKKRGYQARRGQQFSGGKDSPDVKTALDKIIHFEVKRTETLNLYKAMEQAIKDSGKGKLPIVAHKRNRKNWLIIMEVDSFFKVLESKLVKAKKS